MRTLPLALAAFLATGAAAHAQDVRGVIDNLNRALNPQQQQQEIQRDRDRSARPDEDRYWRDYYGNRDDWRDRASRDYGYRGESRDSDRQQSARYDQRDLDRLFHSEGARQVELDQLSNSDRQRYENATPGERRRWDDEFADNARQRWQRMSESDRRRYVEDVQQADRGGRGMSGSSSDYRRR
jgi:hypothetical protein